MTCIYHSKDLDGIASAAIVKHWHSQLVKFPQEGSKGELKLISEWQQRTGRPFLNCHRQIQKDREDIDALQTAFDADLRLNHTHLDAKAFINGADPNDEAKLKFRNRYGVVLSVFVSLEISLRGGLKKWEERNPPIDTSIDVEYWAEQLK